MNTVPKLNLDINQITQALDNILRNALQATNSGGKINVSCDVEFNEVVVTISDTGCGIPEDNLSKIFNLYFTTRDDGTGLGLSIVHQIVSQHGGKIIVDSKECEGTIFKIRFPITEA